MCGDILKFRLVEEFDLLDESVVGDINKKAKRVMKKQAAENPSFDVDPTFFDNCLRHHLGKKDDYETDEQLKAGLLNPSVNIANVDDPELTINAIHFIIENYRGKNFFDLIKYVCKICDTDVVYHCSRDGKPVFRKDKLSKIITDLNRGKI